MTKIVVSLSSNRDKLGQLTYYDLTGLAVGNPYWVLGRADRGYAKVKGDNPTADPLKRYGNTPTGIYSVTGILPTGDGTQLTPTHSYGPNGALNLLPKSGQALQAATSGQRTGLLVHGGDLFPNATLLRPTHGCIRMSNDDIAALITAMTNSGALFPFDLEVNEDFTGSPPDILIGDDPNPDPTSDPPL
jgi:hypothetical protein